MQCNVMQCNVIQFKVGLVVVRLINQWQEGSHARLQMKTYTLSVMMIIIIFYHYHKLGTKSCQFLPFFAKNCRIQRENGGVNFGGGREGWFFLLLRMVQFSKKIGPGGGRGGPKFGQGKSFLGPKPFWSKAYPAIASSKMCEFIQNKFKCQFIQLSPH